MVYFCRGATVHFIHAEYLAWEFLQLNGLSISISEEEIWECVSPMLCGKLGGWVWNSTSDLWPVFWSSDHSACSKIYCPVRTLHCVYAVCIWHPPIWGRIGKITGFLVLGFDCWRGKRFFRKRRRSWEVSWRSYEVWEVFWITRAGEVSYLLLMQLLEGQSALPRMALS